MSLGNDAFRRRIIRVLAALFAVVGVSLIYYDARGGLTALGSQLATVMFVAGVLTFVNLPVVRSAFGWAPLSGTLPLVIADAIRALACGITGTLAAILVGRVLPDGTPTAVIAVGLVVGGAAAAAFFVGRIVVRFMQFR